MRSRGSLRTSARLALLLVVAAVLATGCIRSDLTVNVNEDGSGTYTAIVAINPKAFAELSKSFGGASSGELGDDPCKQIRDDAKDNQGELPAGAKVENYSDGDYCGIKITAPFAAGDNPSEEIQSVLGGVDANDMSGVGLDTFSIKKSGDNWTFEAKPQSSSDSGSLGGTDAAMFDSFLKGAYSIVRIKLPGRVVEKDSNPDAIDGNGTLIWNLNLTGETRTLKARTEPGSAITNKTYTDAGKKLPSTSGGGSSSDSGSSKLPWIIGGVVVVAAIVGFVLWKRSKGTPAPALAGGAGAAPVPGAWTPPVAPDPTMMAAPPTMAAPPMAPPVTTPVAPAAPAAPPQPAAAAPSTPAPGEPQWDAARNAYILWDAGSSAWLQYDNAAGAWKPIQ